MVLSCLYPGWRYATKSLHLTRTDTDVMLKVKEKETRLFNHYNWTMSRPLGGVSLWLCSHKSDPFQIQSLGLIFHNVKKKAKNKE